MIVFIIFQDVPFEFGQIHGVYETREKAEEALDVIKNDHLARGFTWSENDDEQYSIDEWEVE